MTKIMVLLFALFNSFGALYAVAVPGAGHATEKTAQPVDDSIDDEDIEIEEESDLQDDE